MAHADWPTPDALTVPPPAAAVAETAAEPPAAPPAPHGDDLLARLAAQPTDFGFYQVMRRLEALYRDRPRLGRTVRPSQDAMRLAQEPTPIFAPSTLAAFEKRDDLPPRLLVYFFGLFGPDGALPLHLTHYARERRRNNRDPHFQHFADIFHHRALSLFYRAWADVRPTVAFDRPEQDRFAVYLGALIGLGMDSLRERDAMPHLTKLHFAGRFANQTRHPEGLSAILSTFFTMPVRVQTFVGTWLTMPTADRTALGTDPRTGGLGRSVLVGGRVWSRQDKFRIIFGPLSLADYVRLLPGGLSFHRLIPIVRNYVGDTLLWDVNIVLKREEVPPTMLGKQGRLGWTTWMGTRRQLDDAADLYLDASADSFAQRIDERTGGESHSTVDPPAPEAAA
jgi:type VI secretion system protein ImpH